MLNEILIKMMETRHTLREHISRSPSIQLDIISILGALQTWFHCGGCLAVCCLVSIYLAIMSIYLATARLCRKISIYMAMPWYTG